jgi:hypothetical protein
MMDSVAVEDMVITKFDKAQFSTRGYREYYHTGNNDGDTELYSGSVLLIPQAY